MHHLNFSIQRFEKWVELDKRMLQPPFREWKKVSGFLRIEMSLSSLSSVLTDFVSWFMLDGLMLLDTGRLCGE